jgi:hypothetical protein
MKDKPYKFTKKTMPKFMPGHYVLVEVNHHKYTKVLATVHYAGWNPVAGRWEYGLDGWTGFYIDENLQRVNSESFPSK